MGISGLLPLLKDAQEPIHISKYRGLVVGVDAYVWLHRGAYGCAQQLALGQRTSSYVNFAMSRVNMLLHHGIIPFIVFDGGHLPAKAKTEVARAQRREENLRQAKMHLSHGRVQQAREYFVKCVDVTPAMAFQFIKALRVAGIDYIVAPYEADAQLAYLERNGTIQAILTEDSDLLVFGCKTVLYKLNDQGHCIEILHQNRGRCKGLQFSLVSDAHFRQMAILSGCDYLDSIPGMGLKTAYRMLRKCGSVAKALSAARMEGMRVPSDYQIGFEQAEKTFVYQRVFHRSKTTGQTRLVTLTPCDVGTGLAEEDCIGPLLAEDLLEGISRGDIDPITKDPIVDITPSQTPTAGRSQSARAGSSSFYANEKPKKVCQPPSAGQKTLKTFFPASDRTKRTSTQARELVSTPRTPLAPLSNVSETKEVIDEELTVLEDSTPKMHETKSKYFAAASTQLSPGLLKKEAMDDTSRLATFTPTQKRKRCLSTDSGEISSPASALDRQTKFQMQSSPIDEGETFSPNTSPTHFRLRTADTNAEYSATSLRKQETEAPLLLSLPHEENEEESAFDQLCLQRFAFQQTPSLGRSDELSKRANGFTRQTSPSSSNSKRRLAPFLRFDEEDGVFDDVKKKKERDGTPLTHRSRSETIRPACTFRSIGLSAFKQTRTNSK